MNTQLNQKASVSQRGTPQTENHPQTATPVKTLHIPVYSFDDLDDDAKDVARDWYRQGALDYDWWQFTYDDAEQIGLKLESFDLDRNRHATGHLIEDAETVARLIVKNHGEKCETYQTAKAFLSDVKEIKKLKAYDDRIGELSDDFEKSLIEDYSIMLQHEYEYQLSNEVVDDMIRSNEYTFTAEGKREG